VDSLIVTVPPTYPPGCKVVFVGEAPGEQEVIQCEGFVGSSGKILQKIIYSSGLSWEQIGRTNVVKRAPKGGYDSESFKRDLYITSRSGRRKVTEPTSELLAWYGALAKEISEAAPNIAVACGGEALRALCGIGGISQVRGSILPSTLVPGLKVVPLMHPSWIQRSAQWQELYISSEIVRRKVVPQMDTRGILYDVWHETLRPSMTEVLEFLRFAQGKPVSLDIETRAGSIACVGLCVHDSCTDWAICVPIQTTTGPFYHPEEELDFWRGLQYLGSTTSVIGHNVFYDLDWLRDYGFLPSDVHDTMLLFHRMYPELPKGLDFVNMWFTDIPYYKDDGKTWGRNQPDERLWSYNIKDVVATLRCFYALMELGRGSHTRAYQLYESQTRRKMPLAFEMQCLGMPVDSDGVELARGCLTAELDKVRGKLEVITDGDLVIRKGNKKITDKQVADYLYGKLKLPVKRNRKTKALTTDADAIVDLMIARPELEVLKAILAERQLGKAIDSYINARLEVA
jgi:uracil-DNA glycosylase